MRRSSGFRQYMSTLTAGFVSYIRSTIHQLQEPTIHDPDPRLDFWLCSTSRRRRRRPQKATCHIVDAELSDAVLRDAVEALTYHGAKWP